MHSGTPPQRGLLAARLKLFLSYLCVFVKLFSTFTRAPLVHSKYTLLTDNTLDPHRKYPVLTMCLSYLAGYTECSSSSLRTIARANSTGGSTMADQQAHQFSETDVQSLGNKLATFSQTLTPGEQ